VVSPSILFHRAQEEPISNNHAADATLSGRFPPRRTMDASLREQVIARLAPDFGGSLLSPGDKEYEARRTVWNAMVDTRPGLIALCTRTEDVVAAVCAAQEFGLALSVRGGGHSVSGRALSEGCLTIDLGGMRHARVNREQRQVVCGGGCLLSDIDAVTQPLGLVVPAGTVSETGIGGLALGGGTGWLSRKYGLTCDNIVSVEIVLASGEVTEVSAASHPDLFWALHGGGGNFGIVTRFTLQAHRFGPDVRVAAALYRPEDAAEALRQYACLAPTLPRTAGWHVSFKTEMPPYPFVPRELVGQRLMVLLGMWLGDANEALGEDLLVRLTQVGRPVHRVMNVLPFGTGVQKLLDAEFPDGNRYYTKEVHLSSLSEQAIETVISCWVDLPVRGEIVLLSMGGAVTDVPDDSTAFAHRNAPWWLQFLLHWSDPAQDHLAPPLVHDVLNTLSDDIGPGIYLNMLNKGEADDPRRIVEAYGEATYRRLARIKAAHDPDNLFRVNYNIPPAPIGTPPQKRRLGDQEPHAATEPSPQ
jgi:hypothetical protein